MNINDINNQFNNGIIPDEFNYNKTSEDSIDMSKVKYNAFYKTREYFLNKLPKGFETLPGWENIIDKMIDESKTPLEEILERQNISIENIDEQS